MGEGRLPYIDLNKKAAPITPDDLIEIPLRFQVRTLDELIDFVYENNYSSRNSGTRAILCPTNAAVNEVNHKIPEQILKNRGHISVTTPIQAEPMMILKFPLIY